LIQHFPNHSNHQMAGPSTDVLGLGLLQSPSQGLARDKAPCTDLENAQSIRAFHAICESGGLDAAKLLIAKVTAKEVILSGCLNAACLTSHYKIAELIIGTFALTARDYRVNGFEAFITLCAANNPTALCWLMERLKFGESEARACGAYILGIACENGQLEVAQELAKVLKLGPADARYDDNYALRRACHRGRLREAQWLADEFKLTSTDARAVSGHAMRWACARGHLMVAQWIAEKFGFTIEDARVGNNWPLRYACLGGHLELAQWLVDHFRLTGEDASARNYEALRWANMEKHAALVQWFLAKFGLVLDILQMGEPNPK
jgi:hypothetical protein